MSSPKHLGQSRHVAAGALAALAAVIGLRAVAASEWLEHAIANTPVEAALYRAMSLPGVEVLFPRPPKESVAELDKLVAAKPTAPLYSLRARQEEEALEFDRAEADWKAYVAKSSNEPAAWIELADFYQRRHNVKAEYATRLKIGSAAAGGADATTPPANQRNWQAFERAFELAREQAFDDATVRPAWQLWATRYPQQPSVYQRAFVWELDHKHPVEARQWIQRYRTAFPQEQVFPVKAEALFALRGSGADAQEKTLAVYDAAFEPLWPEDLQKSYFALLESTHRTRNFLSQANARLQAKPDDFEAEARIFIYYREQGSAQQATDSLNAYRAGKEQRHAAWTAQELFTFAQLSALAPDYPNAVRYDFALAQSEGKLADGRTAHEAGLAGMIDVLLSAPDAGTPLGAANLSMYRDIGTLDQGPGYWNGVMSLWLNGQSPSSEYAQEDAKAQPYFHRAKAAELLAQLDHDAPQSPDRAALHARMLDAYQGYGDDAAVAREATAYLDAFPRAEDRLRVAFALADVYARRQNTTAEFALYDRMLAELAQQAGEKPLTFAALQQEGARPLPRVEDDQDSAVNTQKPERSQAFDLKVLDPQLPPNPASVAYSRVLERYLGRLAQLRQLPQALAVLRRELDRNPDDPAIYDRLAQFLEANNLSSQTEELYRNAIAHFKGEDWYSKLARFYLRHKRENDYATLTRNVTRIFSGTQLDAWFRNVSGGGPGLFLQLNLYAHQRFPHDTVFIQNLLNAYSAKPTRDDAAWEALLRHSWWESPELTQRYFESLSSSGKLDAEVAKLGDAPTNPAAIRELAIADMWRSHFEQSAPLYSALSEQYPADQETGARAADLQRSLAWLDPAGPQTKIASAVAIENRMLASNPGNTARLERIGDILADHADGSEQSLAASAAYWRRIPALAPGETQLYLDAATVFWDYFQFDDALYEIDLARAHFAQPALFGYEAGAIDEAKNAPAAAIAEYAAAALDAHASEDSYSPARMRLLTLARRPATAKLADSATAAALAAHTNVPALQLRIAVLEEQQRAKEIGPLLMQAVARATTEDEAGEIASYAAAHDQSAVHEAALEKQASLATDPVDRLQLRYALASAYEGRGDAADAAHVIDTVYRENPKLLGVVRATVDFDWRAKRQHEAVSVLLDAGHAAQPQLSLQFLAEVSEKANSAGDAQQARSIAESLLGHDPYNARDLALVAATYINDPAGLAGFYQAKLNALRTDTMSADERKARTALLRRGLIPALTKSKSYAGAIDQYIALLSDYPEDDALVNEAALYALRYDRKQQWLDFLATTTKASPRDSRFFVDLAQSQIIFSDPTAAVEAYTRAIAIRKDRADWYIAKASLDDALGRFDDEVADDTRLYQLTYQDPQWMIAAGRTRARQDREADAVAALETAYLHGTQSTPHDYLALASQLEQWNMMTQAQHDAELGAQKAGAELLHPEGRRIETDDAAIYARILTRARATATAMTTLHAALEEAASSSVVDAMLAELKQRGPLGVTDSAWRARFTEMRKQEAEASFHGALQAMCKASDLYDTPEDRAAFAALLEAQTKSATDADLRSLWIPAAETAHLPELQERWRTRLLLRANDQASSQLQPLISLQHARLRFQALLQTLAAYVSKNPKPGTHEPAMVEMLRVDAETGDTGALLRMVHEQRSLIETDSAAQQIVLMEIAQQAPQELNMLAASSNESLADAAANAALAAAPTPLALQIVATRGSKLDPVWGAQYRSLSSLYAGDTSAPVGVSFRSALAWDLTIGEHLQHKPDTSRELTAAQWFYLAARYGQWMSLPGAHADPVDVMAADLEQAATVSNYIALATSYAEAGHPDAALVQLGHALELAPNTAELDDAEAMLLWSMNRKPDAIAAWRRAFLDLRTLEGKGGAVPESFWSGFALATRHTAARGLTQELESARADVLRTYIARNGSYRSNELLHAEYAAWSDGKDGLTHLLAMASSSKDEFAILNDLDAAPWLSQAARILLLERELQLARAAASDTSHSSDDSSWGYRRSGLQRNLITLYLDAGQIQQAHSLLESLTEQDRAQPEFQQAAIVVAARSGGLAALLAIYSADEERAPVAATLEAAAAQLSSQKDFASSRAVLEFVFARAQSEHALGTQEYLLLAEARLRTKDVEGAVSLLQMLIRSGGDSTANLDSSAALLEKNNHVAEALPFLSRLAASVPWDMTYTMRLAEAQAKIKTGDPAKALRAVAASSNAPYMLRVRAARDLRLMHAGGIGLGSVELDLLASESIDPHASEQPYFALARAAAATQATDPTSKLPLLRDALAISPYGPESDAMRKQLFLAEYAAKQTREARAVLDEWTAVRASTPAVQPWSSVDAASNETENDTDASQPRSSSAAEEDPALLEVMAAVYLATEGRSQAIGTLQREAIALGDVPAAKVVLKRVEQLQAWNRRDAANATRRPVIHRELAQPVLVRTKLEQPPEDDVSATASQEEQP